MVDFVFGLISCTLCQLSSPLTCFHFEGTPLVLYLWDAKLLLENVLSATTTAFVVRQESPVRNLLVDSPAHVSTSHTLSVV